VSTHGGHAAVQPVHDAHQIENVIAAHAFSGESHSDTGARDEMDNH